MSDTLTQADLKDLGRAIAEGIAASGPRRKITAGEYEPNTPWQPKKRLAHKLQRESYQNGYRIDGDKLTNVEIDNLNRIVRPGRYLNRLVEVVIRDDGGEVSLDIRYSNKTFDQRLALKSVFRSFEELVMLITKEQDALLSDERATKEALAAFAAEARKQKKEDPVVPKESFSSAATREARAKAEAVEAAKATQQS